VFPCRPLKDSQIIQIKLNKMFVKTVWCASEDGLSHYQLSNTVISTRTHNRISPQPFHWETVADVEYPQLSVHSCLQMDGLCRSYRPTV